jgi:predicted kinase
MTLTIPELSLVVLVGASGSGKSSFARKHFKPTEILSSDYCRGLVSDDENSQAATNDAFEVLIANHAVNRLRTEEVESLVPRLPRPAGSALWLERL